MKGTILQHFVVTPHIAICTLTTTFLFILGKLILSNYICCRINQLIAGFQPKAICQLCTKLKILQCETTYIANTDQWCYAISYSFPEDDACIGIEMLVNCISQSRMYNYSHTHALAQGTLHGVVGHPLLLSLYVEVSLWCMHLCACSWNSGRAVRVMVMLVWACLWENLT